MKTRDTRVQDTAILHVGFVRPLMRVADHDKFEQRFMQISIEALSHHQLTHFLRMECLR